VEVDNCSYTLRVSSVLEWSKRIGFFREPAHFCLQWLKSPFCDTCLLGNSLWRVSRKLFVGFSIPSLFKIKLCLFAFGLPDPAVSIPFTDEQGFRDNVDPIVFLFIS